MILVTGATGNVGSELVRELARARVPVRALVRSADRPVAEGVETVAGDLNDPGSLRPALRDCEGVFLLAGYRDMPGLLASARDAGVKHIVLLSGGAAVASDLDNAISRYQLDSEETVRGSGMGWTILRPCAFMSNALRWREQLHAGDVVKVPFADVANAVIDPYDIARVAAAALSTDDHTGAAYRLSGPESLLPAQQLRILGDALGRELMLEPQTNEQARAEMEASMPVEYVDAFFSFYVDGTLDESEVLPTVERVTGVPPRTFSEWVAEHAEAFR